MIAPTSQSASVSICIPIYNGAEFLEAALHSVLSQKGVDLQLVVVDDQSTDGSWEISQRVLADYSNFNVIHCRNENRIGMVGNWNCCVEKSDGTYIKLMGQDDLLAPDCLRTQAANLECRPDISMVTCPRILISKTGRNLFVNSAIRGKVESGNIIFDLCLRQGHNMLGEPVAVMARREELLQLGKFNPRYNYYTDLDMWLRLIRDRLVLFMQEPLCSFRIHRGACSWQSQKTVVREFANLYNCYQHDVPLNFFEHKLQKLYLHGRAVLRTIFYAMLG